MTTQFTPNQLRFFLNATLEEDQKAASADKPPQTVLERFLQYDLPDDMRYRIGTLKRQIASHLTPIDNQLRTLYESYQEAIAGKGDDATDATDATGTEDPARAEAIAEAKRKLDEDIKTLMETPVEFTGTLMLGTQLAYPKNPLPDDLRAFLRIPGVEDEWLIPFTLDNLPKN